jgi:flavin-binding protein dodecin
VRVDVRRRTGIGSEDNETTPTSVKEHCVADNTYSKTEIVGSSDQSVDEAIRGAIRRASSTLRQVEWFEVTEIRGHVQDGEVGHFQVTLKVGFALEDTKP